MECSAYAQHYRIEEKYWWFVARRKVLFYFLEKFLAGKKRSEILDYGCGTGGTSKELQKFGKVTCLDSSKEALKFCKKRGLKNLCLFNLDKSKKLPFKNNTFDAITVLDTLEHIDADVKTLAELNRILKRGGLLAITVPAYMSLFSPHDELIGHKRRYTRKELAEKLNLTGYEVVKMTHLFSAFVLPTFILRAYERLANKRQLSVTLTMPPKILNTILNFVMSVEISILRYFDMPFGTSIFCIARKK